MELDKELLKFDKNIFKNANIEKQDENFNKLMFIYSSALKELEVKINVMKEHFNYFYD